MKANPRDAKRGTVIEALPSLEFKVDIDGKIIRTYMCGRMKQNYIRVLPGDKVGVIVSGDLGRIIMRYN